MQLTVLVEQIDQQTYRAETYVQGPLGIAR